MASGTKTFLILHSRYFASVSLAREWKIRHHAILYLLEPLYALIGHLVACKFTFLKTHVN